MDLEDLLIKKVLELKKETYYNLWRLKILLILIMITNLWKI